jgi:hypothetical protein
LLRDLSGKLREITEGRPVLAAFLARLPIVAAVALPAMILASRSATSAEPTPAGVAALLGTAAGGSVDEDDFVWEPSRGWLTDALDGRDVLFLATQDEGARRDLFRARVRVSREGTPFAVRRTRNLTSTPLGDERMLVARGRWVAFATHALGAVQGLTVLDLQGNELPPGGALARAMARAGNFLETGTLAGMGRIDVAFKNPPGAVKIELRDDALVMALGEPPTPALVELADASLRTGTENPFEAWAWRTPTLSKPPAHFVMDGLRDVLGTEAADTVKAIAFDARSRWVFFSEGVERPLAPPEPLPALSDARDGSWPPPPILPLFDHPLEGEGRWQKPPVDWLPAAEGMLGEPDPPLLETVIRPDKALPFSSVRVVAIDTRQLDLRMEAGFDEPRPLTGPRASGRVPDADRPRLVGAFNGAFQTRHGEYGMIVDGRVLLPPKPRAETVAIDVHGRTHIGPWGATEELPPEFTSLRQNLDPLIGDGVINPKNRFSWGFALDGNESLLTERSALCRTSDGYLMYGYGIEVTAETLARGLKLAGCVEAMHLDMNPGHVGFVYYNAAADQPLRAQLVAREMSIVPDRFVKASPKDFFYLVRRDPTPRLGEQTWKPDEGAQPPPAWLPAVYRIHTKKLGTEIDVLYIDRNRFQWDIRAGNEETNIDTIDLGLPPALLARTLIALGLGVAVRKDNQRGLVLDGAWLLPIRADLGLLAATPEGALSITRSREPMAPPGDATELVLLAEGGKLRSEARRIDTHRLRAAACALDGAPLLIASAVCDQAEPLALALMELGCTRVVLLHRGRQVASFIHRAGTEAPPQGLYDDTVLYGLARTAAGTARALDAP